ncbi:hypothetical protein [Actinotignum sp. GS-2025b]|uniref:hypothetical protein n=1 Tax=Actinotignum sp. GS-2025b TaxID=3427275 RepID=UPI003F44ABC6
MDTHVERSVVGVPKALLEDERLSFDALALAVYCLGLGENASAGYRALAGRGLSEARTRKALSELEAAGYRYRGADGRVVISDTPMTTPPTQATAAAPADTASTTGTGRGMVRERRERREIPAGVDVVDECVPAPLANLLKGVGRERATGYLEEALDHGWTKRAIYNALNNNPFPSAAKNPVGLVIYRIRHIASKQPRGTKQPPTPVGGHVPAPEEKPGAASPVVFSLPARQPPDTKRGVGSQVGGQENLRAIRERINTLRGV